MIGFLNGILRYKDQNFILLDVNGIGYEIDVSLNTFAVLGHVDESISLYCHLHVREDILQLYGFATVTEKQLFRRLIKVSGIGPKVALSILSSTRVDDFVFAIHNEDHTTLTRLPGIGKKTAERLVIEMRDSLKGWEYGEFEKVTLNGATTAHETFRLKKIVQNETQAALSSLGYKPVEVDRVLAKLLERSYDSSQELLRDALQYLAKTS